MDELNDSVLKELECPVCYAYMETPITSCEIGHATCRSCRYKLIGCPICKNRFVNVRNFALEHLAFKAFYPCPNDGCNEKNKLSDIKKHKTNCSYRLYQCPINECDWSGINGKILDHWDELHNGKDLNGDKFYSQHYKNPVRQIVVIEAEERIFFNYLTMAYPSYYFNVQYVGPPREAHLYRFEIELGNTKKQMILRNDCQNIDLVKEELMSKTFSCYVNYHTIETLLNSDGSFCYKVKIIKNE